MKKLVAIVLFLHSFVIMRGQSQALIQGTVIDSATRQAIESVDIILLNKQSIVVGQASTNGDGKFSIEDIKRGTYQLLAMLGGYRTFSSNYFSLSDSQNKNCGTIALTEITEEIGEVEVIAERKQIVYKLDKRTISAAGNLLSSGGTAIDILENTPSIRVDAEGEVTFRGSSGFKVYVNGKPSILEGSQALEQIPASQIDNIEIITTPSAKYDTDGDVGMINIITKSVYDNGLNGIFNLTGSTVGTAGFDFMLNNNKDKSRWYVSGDATRRRRESDFDQTKTTVFDNIITTSHSTGPRVGLNESYTLKGGWEYNDKINTFLVEMQGGHTKHTRTGDMDYNETRTNTNKTGNDNAHYSSHDIYSSGQNIAVITTNYTRKFNDKGHQFSASTFAKFDWSALEYYESNMYDANRHRVDGNRAYEKEHRWNIRGNADYVLPYSETGKFEAGYQGSLYIEDGHYAIKFWDELQNQYVWQDNLYNIYFYRRILNSAYAIWSERFNPFEFQAGVRAEHTFDYLDITMQGANRNKKRFELFPSVHLSYSAPHQHIFTLSYSYRTNRPNIWQLEPYITYEDYYTVMIGNPDIKPEYIHVFEFNYRKTIADKHSVSATLFHRARRDKIERIRVPYQPGMTLDSLANVGKDRSSGIELNAQFQLSKRWGLILNGSGYYYNLTAGNRFGTDADSKNYELVINNNFTVTPTTRLQFDANLIGPSTTSQGKDEGYYYFNISARQQLLKRKLTATLSFRDIFDSARYKSTRETDALVSLTKIRPKYPLITLTLSYTFNNYKLRETKNGRDRDLFEGTDF